MARWVSAWAGAALIASSAAAWGQDCKDALSDKPLVPEDTQLCQSLAETVRKPSALPLSKYEAALSTFFHNWCHRDTHAGWVRDKSVRDTGPYTATISLENGRRQWAGAYHGTHEPVVIWYSPEMVEWLVTNRPADGDGPADPPQIPDGAIMVKEMFPAPAAACAAHDPETLFPVKGAAIMVRDRAGAHDGWFWGWYGWKDSGWKPDWPAGPPNMPANMGFGQYCMNCHASARDMTFSDARNLKDQAGEPLVFLSQHFFAKQYLGGGGTEASEGVKGSAQAESATPLGSFNIHRRAAERQGGAEPPSRAGDGPREAMAPVLAKAFRRATDGSNQYISLPSQTYDNVWMPAKGPSPASQYLTSDQCLGCHDAGSTGLQFDMTRPNPHPDSNGNSPPLLNLSPYATWRSSPMGLAGRDPVFFAQLASETESFHPDKSEDVQTICLGCHGILGQRQYQIDSPRKDDGTCADFGKSMVHAVPYPPDNPSAAHAPYGALARDGISCMACHHMVLGKVATEKYAGAPQNACVVKRQELLNPDEKGFAKTFTGSFLVGPPDELYGPFADPQVRPMEHALGVTPKKTDTISSSELCGTCHTVHLPVLHQGRIVGRVYEQTTYPEWAFSAYRTGKTVDGDLPEGAGRQAQSCQGCHMPSRRGEVEFVSKIASIQEYSGFPEAEHRLPRGELDLEARTGFAKHTLVGLNYFLVAMFQQFPNVLGIPTRDPMLVDKGLDPLWLTEREVLDQAAKRTARITVAPKIVESTLSATVKIDSLTGHKLPSGVGFRRAFITFEVLDAEESTLWTSGRVIENGVIVDQNGDPVEGELWWDEQCTERVNPEARAHQPHYQVITKQNQVQIYQELVSTPPLDGDEATCGHDVQPEGRLTTSFLSICAEVKDNRLPPPGYLGLEKRKRIAEALGAKKDLAEDAGFTAVGDDPDYAGPTERGGDTLLYEVALADLESTPESVRATLNYQATPPFYLQDRFCTGNGPDTKRLADIVRRLNLRSSPAENWALKLVDTGPVRIAR